MSNWPLPTAPKRGDLIETRAGMCYIFKQKHLTCGEYWVKPLTRKQAQALGCTRGNYGSRMSENTFCKNHGNIDKLLGAKQTINQGEETMANELYELKTAEKETYGTKVGVKSDGKWLLEVKGTGEIISVDKENLEEVLPYTVAVMTADGANRVYVTEEGSVQVGDLVVVGYTICTVTKVRAKKRGNYPRLTGRVFRGVELK